MGETELQCPIALGPIFAREAFIRLSGPSIANRILHLPFPNRLPAYPAAVHPDCKNSASLDHGTGSPGSAATKASNLHLQLERGPRANGAPPRSSAPVTFDFHSPACGAGESPSIMAEPRAITKTDDGVRGCAAPGTGARSRTPVPSRLLSRKAPSVRSPTPTKLDHEASPGRHSPLTTENFRAPHRSLQGASAGTNTATGRLGASDKGSACRTGANGAASVLVRSRPGQGSLYRACSLRNKLADSVKGSLDGGLFESEDSDVFGMAPVSAASF